MLIIKSYPKKVNNKVSTSSPPRALPKVSGDGIPASYSTGGNVFFARVGLKQEPTREKSNACT